jgi:hypothetical protein
MSSGDALGVLAAGDATPRNARIGGAERRTLVRALVATSALAITLLITAAADITPVATLGVPLVLAVATGPRPQSCIGGQARTRLGRPPPTPMDDELRRIASRASVRCAGYLSEMPSDRRRWSRARGRSRLGAWRRCGFRRAGRQWLASLLRSSLRPCSSSPPQRSIRMLAGVASATARSVQRNPLSQRTSGSSGTRVVSPIRVFAGSRGVLSGSEPAAS